MEPRDKEIITENDISEDVIDTAIGENISENDGGPEKPPLFKRIINCGLFTIPFKILSLIFVFSAVVYLLSRFIPAFAELWTVYPAQAIRFLLAKITGWIPFSLAECVLISLPFIAIGYIVLSTVSTKRDGSDANFYKWLRPLLSFLLFIAIVFCAAFGPAYGRQKLAYNLDLEQKAVSAEELYYTAVTVSNLAEEAFADDGVAFDANGASVMPYGYDELTAIVNDAFAEYAATADYIGHFNSSPKPIALSEPMTYTHISGVYTFMTGESNINTNYPDFLMPFTMAHEMAHQRGIAREDEANFVAFLVCINSDDAFVRYSGYANMVNYLMSALSSADRDKYFEFRRSVLSNEMNREFIAYSEFFDKYRDSTASTVAGTVDNAFLQSQGQTAGTKSYGLVVDLAVAYYKSR